MFSQFIVKIYSVIGVGFVNNIIIIIYCVYYPKNYKIICLLLFYFTKMQTISYQQMTNKIWINSYHAEILF